MKGKMRKRKNNHFYSVTEVANILGISRVAVFKQIKKGKIKAEKIGHFYAIPKTEYSLSAHNVLSEKQKNVLEAGVKKTIKDYREVLEKLGKE